ncbi:MAG: cytochrome c biogenesis protein ResB, partial [Planctomycetota bacterium]
MSLSATGLDDPVWVVAGQPSALGAMGAKSAFRVVNDPDELDRLLNPPPPEEKPPENVVRVEYQGTAFEYALEECTNRAVALGETGYTLRVLRYLPHAIVGPDNKLISASDRPENPAVEVEIVGPDTTEQRLAFAKFPDFQSMHGKQQIEGLQLTFIAGQEAAPDTPVEVLAGPDGKLYGRFSRRGRPAVVRELSVGTPAETPWPGQKLTVLRRFERARVGWLIEPPEEDRRERTPALRLNLAAAEDSSTMWVQKFRPRPVTVGHTPYEITYADKAVPLGFSLKLNRFRIGQYPGTTRPRSFESHVTIIDSTTGRELDKFISMNNPTKYAGYSLFQSSYNTSGGQRISFLSVARDPGLPIVFAGYIMMMGGMAVVLVTRIFDRKREARGGMRNTDQRVTREQRQPANDDRRHAARPRAPTPQSAIRNPKSTIAPLLLALAGATAWASPSAAAGIPASLDLQTVRAIPVQHDGRWPPLDTMARDMVATVTGEVFYQGHDPVALLLAWTFEPEHWKHQPLIGIANAELRAELDLAESQTAFSYAELVGHAPLRSLIRDLSRVERGQKLNPLQSKVSDINEKLGTLHGIFDNHAIHLIPDAKEFGGPWHNIPLSTEAPAEEDESLEAAWGKVRQTFLADDGLGFSSACDRLAAALQALPAAHRPAAELIATELRYNRLGPFSYAWKVMIAAAILAALAMLVQMRWFDLLA